MKTLDVELLGQTRAAVLAALLRKTGGVVGVLADALRALAGCSAVLGREVNPTPMPLADFAQRLARGDGFAASVAAGPRLWIKGAEHEFAELAGHRPAYTVSHSTCFPRLTGANSTHTQTWRGFEPDMRRHPMGERKLAPVN